MTTLRLPLAISGAGLLLAGSASAQISFNGATSVDLLGQQPDWIATGDFDADGDEDFAVSTDQGGPDLVEIFHNNGDGTFTAAQSVSLGGGVSTAAVVACDFDGDFDIDLAVSLKDQNAVRILINDGSGFFALGDLTAGTGTEPRHMAVADVDADGDRDLVTSNRESNNLTLLLNDGAGDFSVAGTLAVGQEPRYVVLADLNGDCMPDIAVAAHDSRRVDLLFNNGSGGFGGLTSLTVPGNEKPTGMAAADLDADGDVDLVTSTDNNDIGVLVVYRNQGGGSFLANSYVIGGQNPDAVIAADLDGDGDKDLATIDEDGNAVITLANIGGGLFGGTTSTAVGANPNHLAAADLDGNGSIDLLTANRNSNDVSVVINANAGGAMSYCQTSPNSVGAGALIDFTGSMSIAANQFTLTARCAPAMQNGIFFFGPGKASLAFGNGQRCVGAPLSRLIPPVMTDGSGQASRLVDFTTDPGDQITAGTTVYFQFWYRDPAGGGAFFNLTDGLSATFNP